MHGGVLMLSIRFGITDDTVKTVDSSFNNEYEDEWLEEPIVKEMIQSVDLSEVLTPEIIKSPALGLMPPTKLSGGVKALILMLKTDWEIWATACGDNCAEWILKIAEEKDLTISLTHFMVFPDFNFEFFNVNTGQLEHDYIGAWGDYISDK